MNILILSDLHIDTSDNFGTFQWDDMDLIMQIEGLRDIYNIDKVIFNGDVYELLKYRFEEIRNAHPVLMRYFSEITYWENYPMLPKSFAIKSFLDDMRICIRLSEKEKESSKEAEHLLINLCARGMLLLFYSENDFSSEVIPIATSTYPHIRRSLRILLHRITILIFLRVFIIIAGSIPRCISNIQDICLSVSRRRQG